MSPDNIPTQQMNTFEIDASTLRKSGNNINLNPGPYICKAMALRGMPTPIRKFDCALTLPQTGS